VRSSEGERLTSKGKYKCPGCDGDTQRVAVISSGAFLITDFTVDSDGRIHGSPSMCLIPHHNTGKNENLIGSYCPNCSVVIVGMYDRIIDEHH
jgi:hypothetical protein